MEGWIKRRKAVAGPRDAEIKTEKKGRDKEKRQIEKKNDKVTSEKIVFIQSLKERLLLSL